MISPEQMAFAGSESAHQKALFVWIGQQPKDSPLRMAFAIPNGGARSLKTASRMKAEGARSGVPDIFLPVARGDKHGLFIEMKIKDNKPSAAQNGWIEKLTYEGYACCVCYSWEQARDTMLAYLKIEDENADNA